MPVTSVTTDPDALTMTLVGDFPVPVERLWDAFADPRQLERFWGPPGYPATFGEETTPAASAKEFRVVNFAARDHNGNSDVFVHDRRTNETTIVSVRPMHM